MWIDHIHRIPNCIMTTLNRLTTHSLENEQTNKLFLVQFASVLTSNAVITRCRLVNQFENEWAFHLTLWTSSQVAEEGICRGMEEEGGKLQRENGSECWFEAWNLNVKDLGNLVGTMQLSIPPCPFSSPFFFYLNVIKKFRWDQSWMGVLPCTTEL